MNGILPKLLNMSFAAGVLTVVVLLLRLCLKKAPRKLVCVLWALVGLRLLCPFSVSSGLSAFNLLRPETDAAGQMEIFRAVGEGVKPSLTFDVPAVVNDALAPESVSLGTRSVTVYLPLLTGLWLAGTAGMLGCALVSYLRLRRRVAASVQAEEGVFVCDSISSPFLLGILRPRVYLPSGMEEKTRRSVLAHERAHLRRLDQLWKPLGYLLLSVYWFNPILWLAYLFLVRDIEAACDEKVIASLDRAGIADYSEALLACALRRGGVSACPVAFGETDAEGRVKHVLRYKKPAVWIVCAAALVCAAAALMFLTGPRRSSFSLRVVIPAGCQNEYVYSDEELSPLGRRVVLAPGKDTGDLTVVLDPTAVQTETAYEPVRLTRGSALRLSAEKGGWFRIGVLGENPTDEDVTVFVTAKNVTVRISAAADAETSSADVLHEVERAEEGNGYPPFCIDGVTYCDTGKGPVPVEPETSLIEYVEIPMGSASEDCLTAYVIVGDGTAYALIGEEWYLFAAAEETGDNGDEKVPYLIELCRNALTESESPETLETITNWDAPTVRVLEELPRAGAYLPLTEEPGTGPWYEITFTTTADPILGPIAFLVNQETEIIGSYYRE